MDVTGASIAVPFDPNTLSSTTADTPGMPAQPLNTVTPATGVPVVTQDFNSPLAENTSTPPPSSVRPFTVRLTMADVKRRLDDTDQHVNTAELNADHSKRTKTNGIALDDNTVFSFLRVLIVDSIVADKNIVPSKLTTSAAVARVCHNNFNYSWSRSTKSPPSTTKAGRPSRKKKEVAADVPRPAKLPNTWHHRNFPSVDWSSPLLANPISPFHRRLVLEDYLRLELQELVVILVSDKHPAFNSFLTLEISGAITRSTQVFSLLEIFQPFHPPKPP
jgi:hypothetical protein